MKKPSYTTLTTYLKEIHFSSPNTPGIFLDDGLNGDAVNKISIDTETKGSADKSLFLVELHANIIPQIVPVGKNIMELDLTYCALVRIVDIDLMDGEELRKILTVEVPQGLYEPLRTLVFAISTASGFPGIMIGEFDFSKRSLKPSIENNSLCS